VLHKATNKSGYRAAKGEAEEVEREVMHRS
jgi:hypothetical protein